MPRRETQELSNPQRAWRSYRSTCWYLGAADASGAAVGAADAGGSFLLII